MINLVLQSFGRENEYKRAILTILSFYAFVTKPVEETKVLLFTDRPDYFQPYVKGLPIQYVMLTPEKIKEMRGQIDFLHRMKIALIEEAFSLTEGPLFYADSDTFFTADPTVFIDKVSPESAFMHMWEYQFKIMKEWGLPAGETFQAFYRLITSKTFMLSDGSVISVTPEESSWNAGVMVFHPSHVALIADVYALTDQFYPSTQNHAAEQYAFSVILQNQTNLQPCSSVIYHYWYRVRKQIVDDFLSIRLNTKWANQPLKTKVQEVGHWSLEMPDYLEKHPWTLRDNALQAFDANQFKNGYVQSAKALLKAPLNGKFIIDVLYHIKRHLVK